MDFGATGQLLIIYSAFVKYLRKNGKSKKLCISFLLTSRKLMIQLGGRFCKFLIEFGIPMNLVRLIKMCLTETYDRVRVGKHLSDMFSIKNGSKRADALTP